MATVNTYRQASFRGVPFFVESREEEGGRRVVIHEFPQRDEIYAEDMGKKARQIPVEAYVLGEDWLSQREALVAACEEEGPGTLVLPRRASLRVVCTGWRYREVLRERRIIAISMTFVECGQAAYPSTSKDTRWNVRSSADSSRLAAARLLDSRFSLTSMPSFVSDNALADVSGLVSSAGRRTAVGDPTLYAESMGGLSGLSAADLSGPSLSGLLSPLYSDAGTDVYTDEDYNRARFTEMGALATSSRTLRAARYPTAARLQDVQNQRAIYGYERQMSVAEMARSASYITPRTTTEASSLRRAVTSAIDAVLGETDDDEVYTSYSGLRTATVRDMTTRSRYAAEPYTVTTPRRRTSLAVSGQVYGGSYYEPEISYRNRTRHPGFLDTALEVLRYVG